MYQNKIDNLRISNLFPVSRPIIPQKPPLWIISFFALGQTENYPQGEKQTHTFRDTHEHIQSYTNIHTQ